MKKPLSAISKAVFALIALLLFFALAETASYMILKLVSPARLKQPSFFPAGYLADNNRFVPDSTFYQPPGSDILVKLNNNALRSGSIPYRKDKDEFRILVLGNSSAFGWGVQQDRTFSKVLENLCNAGGGRIKYTVINAGIPGFSSFNSIALMKSVGLRYEPDAVIAYLMNSDEILTKTEDKPLVDIFISNLGVFSHSRLISLLRELSGALGKLLLESAAEKGGEELLRPRVSRQDYRNNLEKLCGMAEKNNIKLYLVMPVVPSDAITDKGRLDRFLYEHTDTGKINFQTRLNRERLTEEVKNEMAAAFIKQKKAGDAEGTGDVKIDLTALEAEVSRRLVLAKVEKSTRLKTLSLYRNIVYYVDDYRNIMLDVGREYKVRVVNLPLEVKADLKSIIPEDIFLDEIHPSAAGHARIAEILYGVLKKDLMVQ